MRTVIITFVISKQTKHLSSHLYFPILLSISLKKLVLREIARLICFNFKKNVRKWTNFVLDYQGRRE